MKCRDCVNSYDGDDGVLRCRPSQHGAECTEVRASLCSDFVKEPGADSQERELLRGLCAEQGRGD